jgi:metallothiol transferase
MQIEISDTFYEELKKYMEICEETDLSGFVNKSLKMLYSSPEKKNIINHMTFSVSDLNKSIEFYSNVLGATLLVKGEKLAYFDLKGLWIALNLQKDIKRNEIKTSYSHISFSIDDKDYEEIIEKLKNLDVKILEGRQRNIDEGRSIYFEDPDGHKFEFHTKTREDRINYYKKSGKNFTFYHA